MQIVSRSPDGAQVSAEVFQAVCPNFPDSRRIISQCLLRHSSRNANEITKEIPKGILDKGSIKAGLRELLQLGLVMVDAKVTDPVGGKKARCYRVVQPGEQAEAEILAKPSRAKIEQENEFLRPKRKVWQGVIIGCEERLRLVFDRLPEACDICQEL